MCVLVKIQKLTSLLYWCLVFPSRSWGVAWILRGAPPKHYFVVVTLYCVFAIQRTQRNPVMPMPICSAVAFQSKKGNRRQRSDGSDRGLGSAAVTSMRTSLLGLCLVAFLACVTGTMADTATLARDLASLPEDYRRQLEAFHQDTKPTAPRQPNAWTLPEDASLLMQHKAGPKTQSLPKVVIAGRKHHAIATRYKKHLKPNVVSVVDAERARAPSLPIATQMQARLDKTQYHVDESICAALVDLHVKNHGSKHADTKRWTIEEDACILHAYAAHHDLKQFGPTGRTSQAIHLRMNRLRRWLPFPATPFPRALCHAELPWQPLPYHTWTPIASDMALPPSAHVDWQRGVAKVPSSWALHLNSTRICLWDRASEKPICVDESDAFILEDVNAEMTIGDIERHLRAWMSEKASPGAAQGVVHKDIRLAFLDTDAHPGAAARAPLSYHVGQRVRHRCRDGVHRPSTITSKSTYAGCETYTIVVDGPRVRAAREALSRKRPPPPSPKPAAATLPEEPPLPALPAPPLSTPQPEKSANFATGERIWYAGRASTAPCQARVDTKDSNGTYQITLEGEERETTTFQHSPLSPAQPTPLLLPDDEPSDPWANVERPKLIEHPETTTAADADLFNNASRLVVVTADVQDYWSRW